MDEVLWRGVDVLSHGQDIAGLRKMVLVSMMRRHFHTDHETVGLDSPSMLLAKLPAHELSTVADIAKGKTGIKDAKPGPYPLVVTAEARSECDHFDYEGPAVVIPMVSSTGHGDASLKRIHYQEGQYAVGTILAVVRPLNPAQLSARYLYEYLSAFKDELLVSRMVGTANVSLTVRKLGDIPVPLIPIESQRQIERLMALCDRLEADQADVEAAHTQIVQALLDSLTQATGAAGFRASWQRLSEHFHTLFTTEASIDALKRTVLQLAVKGLLVQSDSGRWIWTTLCEVITGMDSGWSPACDESSSSSDDVWGVLRTTAVQQMRYVQSENKTLPSHLEPRPTAEVKEGDVLFTRAGPMNRVGISCLVESTRPKLMLSDKIIRFRLKPNVLIGRFAVLCLNAGVTAKFLDEAKSGMAASQVNISQAKLKSAPIPVPPLAEQHRIVAKVDELMVLCDQLKAGLAESRQLHGQLATALVEQAVA